MNLSLKINLIFLKVTKLYNVNKLQILMRKLTHHSRKTSSPAVTKVIFCPVKQRLSGETFAKNNYIRRNAISPDALILTICPAKRLFPRTNS